MSAHYAAVRRRFVQVAANLIQLGRVGSIAELAGRIKAHPSQLSRLISKAAKPDEESKEAPTIDMLVNLAEAYDVSYEWLLGGHGTMYSARTQQAELNRLRDVVRKVRDVVCTD